MNPDALSGRDLDASIATELFGFIVKRLEVHSRSGTSEALYDAGPDEEHPVWVRVPYYSSTLSASTQVELELRNRGRKLQEPRGATSWDSPGDVLVVLVQADGGRTVQATGRLEEALCRAALKALAR